MIKHKKGCMLIKSERYELCDCGAMNQSNKALREIEIPFEEQKKIFKFLEDYAANPSNSNKYRYGLIGYLQDELLPALVTNHIKGALPKGTLHCEDLSVAWCTDCLKKWHDEVHQLLEEVSNGSNQ